MKFDSRKVKSMKTTLETINQESSALANLGATLETAILASKSMNTKTNYAAQFNQFRTWCDSQGLESLPAKPETVAGWLAHRHETGKKIATIKLGASAIASAHKLANQPNPTDSLIVRTVLEGFTRITATVPIKQAKPLDIEAVSAIRGFLNGKPDQSAKSARDMAIVSVLSDSGLRRSEAAALTWRDVEFQTDGTAVIAIRKSKSDQHGEGAAVAITEGAAADLARLKKMTNADDSDSVFNLVDRSIARRIKSLAKSAGLGDGYSGHSGRTGLAIRMTRNGAPIAATCRQGRWATPRMVNAYTRNEQATEALKYL